MCPWKYCVRDPGYAAQYHELLRMKKEKKWAAAAGRTGSPYYRHHDKCTVRSLLCSHIMNFICRECFAAVPIHLAKKRMCYNTYVTIHFFPLGKITDRLLSVPSRRACLWCCRSFRYLIDCHQSTTFVHEKRITAYLLIGVFLFSERR